MKNIIKWALVACLLVWALTWQCPTPQAEVTETSAPTPTPTHTPTPRPTATPTPIAPQAHLEFYETPLASWLRLPYPAGWKYHFQARPCGFGFYWYKPEKSAQAPLGAGGAFSLVQPPPSIDLQSYLDDMAHETARQYHIIDGTFVVNPTQVTVWGQQWPGFEWMGDVTETVSYDGGRTLTIGWQEANSASVSYTGMGTVLPYGQQLLEIRAFAPTELWPEYEATVAAILAELPQAPEDYVYVPSPDLLPPEEAPTSNWSGFMTTNPGLSVRYPPGWKSPPDRPWTGNGAWLKSADEKSGMVIWMWPGANAAQMLAAWETAVTGGGYQLLTADTVADGEAVTVVGRTAPTKVAQGTNAAGENVTAQAACVDLGSDVMQIVWYAPTEAWDGMQETFAAMLESIGAWKSYTDQKLRLFTVYPYDWSAPAKPAGGEGILLASADAKTALEVRVVQGDDPAQALEAWRAAMLAGEGPFTDVELENGGSVYTMGMRPSTRCQGKDASGAAVTCGVVFVPRNDQMLQVLWYAPAERWEEMQEVFRQMLSMLTDVS